LSEQARCNRHLKRLLHEKFRKLWLKIWYKTGDMAKGRGQKAEDLLLVGGCFSR
jgi:hypothetical protein